MNLLQKAKAPIEKDLKVSAHALFCFLVNVMFVTFTWDTVSVSSLMERLLYMHLRV